jgi:uncharacterized protein (TIGR00730 family)
MEDKDMKRLAVFCGSRNGVAPEYREGAIQLGKELVKRGLSLVYGGGSVGLMGAVADSMIEEGGEVIGVMPHVLHEREISHPHLTELILVETMHERKAKMASIADGFIILPGGPGTMEEFFEVFTWAVIGIHQKPIGLLNVHQYYEPLLSLFDHMVEQQFLQEKSRSLIIVESDPKVLLDRLSMYHNETV